MWDACAIGRPWAHNRLGVIRSSLASGMLKLVSQNSYGGQSA
jgi:hypothetical protein